jgi:enoyl-CoA hydratase/carnithine racemase
MTALRDYEDKYPSIRFERRKGVLQMTLHHEGGELTGTESSLRDLGRAFRDVGEDDQNKVVILTGTGERFVTQFDCGSFVATMRPDIFDFWLRSRTDGVRLLQAFLDIEVPVISAINGPVVTHSAGRRRAGRGGHRVPGRDALSQWHPARRWDVHDLDYSARA